MDEPKIDVSVILVSEQDRARLIDLAQQAVLYKRVLVGAGIDEETANQMMQEFNTHVLMDRFKMDIGGPPPMMGFFPGGLE